MKELFIFRLFIPFVCLFILYPYMWTVRLKLVDHQLKPWPRDRKNRQLFGHYHEDIPLLFVKYGFANCCTMSSQSRDGKYIASMLHALRYRVVRGSPKKGWRSAFKEMVRATKEGWDLVLAVDGPKGPRRQVKPGITHLGKLSGAQVRPIAVQAKYRYTFQKSWDQIWLPMPFSPAVLVVGEALPYEAKHELFQQALKETKQKAVDYFA